MIQSVKLCQRRGENGFERVLFWKGCTDPTFLFTTRVDICTVVLRRPSCGRPSCAVIQSTYASGLLHRSSREKGRWKSNTQYTQKVMRLQGGYLSCVSIQWNIALTLLLYKKNVFSLRFCLQLRWQPRWKWRIIQWSWEENVICPIGLFVRFQQKRMYRSREGEGV